MKKTVKGCFEIESSQLPVDEATQTVGAMRMAFKKRFTGALEATSVVSMMGIMNREIGSGAYVALERIIGNLEGRKGSFSLQHGSSMTRGIAVQKISVVPDTGTEELKNLAGEMIIDIIDGQHFYTFSYEFD